VSDRATTVAGDVGRVLVVGDSAAIDETAAVLTTSLDAVSLVREQSLPDARRRLAETDVHCVVCAFDGPEAIAQLRDGGAKAQPVPIVAIADEEAATAALEAGATDVIGPTTPGRLVATRVSNAVERYRLATARPAPRYRSILDESATVVCVIDDEGTIEYVNASVEDRMGYTPAELGRTTLFQLIHPQDRASIRETVTEVARAELGSTARTTVRLGHATGTWHVSELHVVNRQSDPRVAGLVVTVLPPSPAEAAAEPVQTAIDRLDEAFFAVGPQWELRVYNDAARTLFGSADDAQTPEPVPGTVVWELLPDAIRGEFTDRLREAAATGSVVRFETSPSSAADRLAVTASPSETGVSVTARRVPDSEPLSVDRDRLARLEAIVDAIPDGVAVLADGTITDANAALFDLTEAETLVGTDIEALVDADLAAAIRERSRSPLVRWMEPLTGELLVDGEGRPIDVSVISLGPSPDDRTCCVIRDRRGSSAMAIDTLSDTVSRLGEATDRSTVYESAVDAIRSYTAADVAVWYAVDESVLRPRAVATPAPAADAELPAIDRRDDSLTRVFDTDGAAIADRDELEPFLSRSGIRGSRVLTVPIGENGLVLATSTEPTGFDRIDLDPIDTLATIVSLTLDGLESETQRRELERGQDTLESIVAQGVEIRELEAELFDADTREAAEERLAEGLLSIDAVETAGSIELAWVGSVATGGDEVTVQTWAGREGAFLDTLSIAADADVDEPTGRTAATRETTVIDDLEDATRSEAQQLAVERGFRAAMSVPLVYDGFCYGTVTVYADRPTTFDARTRAVCEHLATVAGYVITAIERKRALVSDSATELELLVASDADPVTTVAHHLDSPIAIRTVAPRSSGGTTLFCAIGTDEAAIRDAVAAVDGIDSCRFIASQPGDSLVELVCPDDTLAGTLAEHGAVLDSITPTEDRSRLVLELSSTVDVRSFVGMVDRTFPGTELTARRERDRSRRQARSFDAELRDRLSERQLRTLETAYHSGFFEWPRESTGEEVADSLGVSQPTFSRHFRLAQQKLFALLFEERSVSPPDEE